MSAVDLYTTKDEVLDAMRDVKARCKRVIALANAADSAALCAISQYSVTGNAAYLACVAAERTWNGFRDEYDSMSTSLGVLNGEDGLGSYSDLLATTNADHRLNTPYDLGILLAAIDSATDSIRQLCKDVTTANGTELGLAALQLAAYAHQTLVWKCGIHWPEIYGNLWPRTDMRVMRVELKDIGGGDEGAVIACLDKAESDGGAGRSFWYSYLWAHAGESGGIRDTSWAYPPDVAAGDILRIQTMCPNLPVATPDIEGHAAQNAALSNLAGLNLTVGACDANTYDVVLAGAYGLDVVSKWEFPRNDPGVDRPGSPVLQPLGDLMLRKVYSAGDPDWPSSGDPTA